jgi:hypothetical protein
MDSPNAAHAIGRGGALHRKAHNGPAKERELDAKGARFFS